MSVPISARTICAVAGAMPGTASSRSSRTWAVTASAAGSVPVPLAVASGGDLFQGLGDEAVEFVDVGGEMVGGVQQHA